MISRLFNRLGAKALQVAPSVQEATIASVIHYGPMILRLAG